MLESNTVVLTVTCSLTVIPNTPNGARHHIQQTLSQSCTHCTLYATNNKQQTTPTFTLQLVHLEGYFPSIHPSNVA